MQDSSKWRQACRKCHALSGEPCIVVIPSSYGKTKVADKVHFGRGSYYERPVRRPRTPYVPQQHSQLFAEAHREVEQRKYGD